MTCPKCGGQDVVFRYHANKYDSKSGFRRFGGCRILSAPTGEHHDVRCSRCLYEWAIEVGNV